MKSRLLMFCSGYPSAENKGRGIFTHRSALELAKDFNLEVVVFSAFNFKRPLKRRYSYEGISVVQIAVPQLPHREKPILLLLNFLLLRWIGPLVLGKKYLRSWQYYHSTMLIPTSIVVASWARKHHKKHIGQAIGDDVNIYLPLLSKSEWIKRLLWKIDYYQFNSDALRRQFLQYIDVERNRSFVLFRGVDLTQFTKNGNEQLRSSIRFLFLGGMQTYDNASFEALNTKGGHVLMEAWKIVEKSNPQAELVFGGPGVDGRKLQPWLSELRHPERVRVLENPVPPEQVPQMLTDCEVVIIPSLFEGLPNLANEAQACGVPVIGSDAGGIPETVVHDVTGRIFPRSNAEALAENIAFFVNDPAQITLYGNRGRKRMEAGFSWENFRKTIKMTLEEYK